MKNYLEGLPQELRNLIRIAAEVAAGNDTRAYLVGGFARDLILGVKNLDLDIVIEGDGIKFAEELCLRLKGRLTRHRRFGTATVTVRPHLKIDVASARRETYPEPAHLPVVEPGTLQDDLFRRDFTINAMAISINKDDFGALVDYFSGKRDLSAKKIRVLHDLSFIDDPTRILREVRFEQRYGFRIEAKTLRLLKEALRLKMLEKVQPQRTRDDLILCLKEECPLKEVKRLQNLGGFGFISRHLSVSRNTYALLRSIESQIKWYKKTFPHRRHLDTWLLYFMGMIDALSLKEARQVCRKFALRRGEKKRVLSFKALRRPFITALSKKNAKPSGIYARLEPLSYETMILIRAKYGNPALAANINAFLRDYNGMRIRISGEDLRALGLTPGKRYQKIFRQVLNARLDGRIRTREEELALAAKLAKQ